jgi:hypothetical protein
MSRPGYNKRTTIRHEFNVGTAGDRVDVGRAIDWAEKEFLKVNGRDMSWDDDMFVGVVNDTEVIFYFMEEKVTPP